MFLNLGPATVWRRWTGPKGEKMAAACLEVDSQDLSTILHPIDTTILVVRQPIPVESHSKEDIWGFPPMYALARYLV